jgi:TatD DNase family protein
MNMWIDTHCHLDAHEFVAADGGPPGVGARAAGEGVAMIVIPAVERGNFAAVAQIAAATPNACYALGIHPMCVPQATDEDLEVLRDLAQASLSDPRFVAIGEVGLDYFIPQLCEPDMRIKQEKFFRAQLRIARDLGLPVLTHVRRSQDQVLKHVRQITPPSGIAHAFNGSFQQAQTFIDLGFHLGFGGAFTFTRALQIRRLATQLPLTSIVMETDAPDISPAWIHPARNSPENLAAIGVALAALRGLDPVDVAAVTTQNALAAMPRLASLTQ